ncbi:hypothetical protein [Phenylobacterium conjunctum]|jgi:hypothetical protein|uniref:Uncharacterized protein n=1 Tax=Phenylobacterium conjunctum TaxID=1298959 RepID=A0ABW3T171_9CAUL
MDITRQQAHPLRGVPRELINIVGTALALFAVVAAGGLISSVLPDNGSPWLFAASYGAPAAVAFVIYWWIAQKL